MSRLLLIGSGITSAVAGTLLQQKLPELQIIIWDEAKQSGGRMLTSRCNKNSDVIVDLGAQYITVTARYKKLHFKYYEDLKEAGILKPMTSKVAGMKDDFHHCPSENFIIPSGSSSLVNYYLRKINSDVTFENHISKINSIGSKWEVTTQKGVSDIFDIVITTMPVPQLFALEGSIKELIESNTLLSENLCSVEYSSRFALGLFYPENSKVELKDSFSAQYGSNDQDIRFIAIDNLKRNVVSRCPSVVLHTSVPFGKAHIEKTLNEMEAPLLAKVKQLFPHWPEPCHIKCHKWRYSQVTRAYPEAPGCISIADGLIAGGDGFVHSNFDGCIESAEAIASQVVNYINSLTS